MKIKKRIRIMCVMLLMCFVFTFGISAAFSIPITELSSQYIAYVENLYKPMIYWFLDRYSAETYPYYLIMRESTGSIAYAYFFTEIKSVSMTSYGTSYGMTLNTGPYKVYRITMSTTIANNQFMDYSTTDSGSLTLNCMLNATYDVLVTNVTKDLPNKLVSQNYGSGKIISNDPILQTYYDFMKGSTSGGYTNQDKEFLQSIINTITTVISVTNSTATEISNKLTEELYRLEQIKQETIKQTTEITESVKKSALDMIEAQKSALIDINNPDSMISQFNTAFKSGVKDGLSGSKSGYQIKDSNGNYIPIDSNTGEYILPKDSTGKPIIPTDKNGKKLIPTNPDGSPMNSRDIGKTDILSMSIENIDSLNEEISAGLEESFEQIKEYMSADKLTVLYPTFNFVRDIFQKILDGIGSQMQSVIIFGMTFGVCLWLIGVGVKQKGK